MRAIALSLLLVSLPAAVALAQNPSAKDKQKAGDLVKQAIAKSQAGDHQAAIDLYNDAFKIIPQPLLLSNIGSEYQQMDHKEVEALGYFCKYLAADPNGNNVGFATAQAKTLYIKLGGESNVKDEDVCKPIVKPTPVVTQPDTHPIDETQPVGTQPPGGNGPEAKSSPVRYVGAGIAVVGVGLFGFGVYEGMQAKKISDEITNHPMGVPWEANIKAKEAEGRSDEKKQIGFMIGGGIAVAAGAAMFLLIKPHAASSEHVSVAPVVTSDTLGFAAAGSF